MVRRRVDALTGRLYARQVGALRGLFTNLDPTPDSLLKGWKRGVYRPSQRGDDCPIRDVRGPVVGTIATPQTFLSDAEIDGLVGVYLTGATVAELATKYKVHRARVSKHLTHEGVARRLPGLHGLDAAEAVHSSMMVSRSAESRAASAWGAR